MKNFLIIAFVINQILAGSMQYMLGMIRCLQMVLHLPLINIVVPGNVTMIFAVIIPIAMFDVLDNESYNYSTLFKFDQQTNVSDQVQDIGYDNNSAMNNLGSIVIYIFYYIARVLVVIVLAALAHICGKGKQMVNDVSKRLFFGDLLSICIDGYLELLISGFLNLEMLNVAESKLLGDVISYYIAVLSLFLTLVLVPLIALYILL